MIDVQCHSFSYIYNNFEIFAMNQCILQEGSEILIKRTNGNVQKAIISSIDFGLKCVKVEWTENNEIKGKEVNFDHVLSLNPEYRLVPKGDEKFNNTEHLNNRNSVNVRPLSAMDKIAPIEIKGRSIFTANSARSRVKTSSSSDDLTLKMVKSSQCNRVQKHKNTLEFKAHKEELSDMILNFRQHMKFNTAELENDPIQDHLIKVVIRKRPLNKDEELKGEIDIITVPNINHVIVHEPKVKLDLRRYLENHVFKFDCALDENCSNEIIYNYTAQPLIKTIFDGGFATCFAYGQTGSGKTYTMSGFEKNSQKGIYALSAADIFKQINSPKYNRKFQVSCSFFEIYGKQGLDLLNKKQKLRILEDGHQQVQIVGLTEKVVTREKDILELITMGSEERSAGKTSKNFQSSRSHAIFQIFLRTRDVLSKIHGKFSLIDLAGNERGADTSLAPRITRIEGAEINQSLLSLKECIRALGRKDSYLPFRASKLTQVLRDSFVAPNSKTCMIALISPGSDSCENTLNTLRYADRVKELGKGQNANFEHENGLDKYASQTSCFRYPKSAENDNLNLKLNEELVEILNFACQSANDLLSKYQTNNNYSLNLEALLDNTIYNLKKIKFSIEGN